MKEHTLVKVQLYNESSCSGFSLQSELAASLSTVHEWRLAFGEASGTSDVKNVDPATGSCYIQTSFASLVFTCYSSRPCRKKPISPSGAISEKQQACKAFHVPLSFGSFGDH